MNGAVLPIFAAAVLWLGASAQAQAQPQSPVGQSVCEMTYTEFDHTGNRTSGHGRQYAMAIYPNGVFDVSGNVLGGVGASPFQGRGQWTTNGAVFTGEASIQEQSLFGVMPSVFIMLANLAPDGRSMMHTYEQPDPSQTYVMNRSNYYCERRG